MGSVAGRLKDLALGRCGKSQKVFGSGGAGGMKGFKALSVTPSLINNLSQHLICARHRGSQMIHAVSQLMRSSRSKKGHRPVI